ncbi:hypothetical protein B2J93_5595 [Marssonina coronariae]|uniref:Uncharacterized protein n=1 Tax=Diplocarpon coronariae TaxID=2795749 RepID=A0A218Z2M1_9HELO|nr:hypothetical protein B2J93_5595 [Marssonina coronariae]
MTSSPASLLCVAFLLGPWVEANIAVRTRFFLNSTAVSTGTDVNRYTPVPIPPEPQASTGDWRTTMHPVWANETAPTQRASLTNFTSTNTTYDPGSLECLTQAPGEPLTVYSIVPNTTTVTLTRTGNQSVALPMTVPEFIPPTYCASPTSSAPAPLLLDLLAEPSQSPLPRMPAVTIITTSKNAPTVMTDAQIPLFPGAGSRTRKQTIDPNTLPNPYNRPIPTTMPPAPIPTPIIFNGDRKATTRITHAVDGKTIVVSPHQAVIGGQILEIKEPPRTITEGGDVFIVSPNRVQGPGFEILVPTFTPGAASQNVPAASTPITIQGVPVQVRPTDVVLGSSTIPIPPGATPTKVVVGVHTISVGPNGVGFAPQQEFPGTFITHPPTIPTNVVVIGGQVFSAIRNSLAVIGDRKLTYGPGIEPQTLVLNGEVITVGPQGVVFDGKTIGGPSHAAGTQYAVAGGVYISEIGSTLAVVNGVTFTVGPGSTPLTTMIAGQKIIAGPSGIDGAGNVLEYPFNQKPQRITAGGITFSKVGNSLAIIGGKTYRYGPGATQVTTTIDGKVVRFGPNGIGFASTTFVGSKLTSASTTVAGSTPISTSTPSYEASSTETKKSGAGREEPGFRFRFGLGFWTMCLSFYIWIG